MQLLQRIFSGPDREFCLAFLRWIIDEIVKVWVADRVELRGFGVFSAKLRGARKGPKTGAEVQAHKESFLTLRPEKKCARGLIGKLPDPLIEVADCRWWRTWSPLHIFLQASHREQVQMSSMKKEEARRAVLSEYDRWAKKHPNDARMMGGFLFFRYLQKEKSDLLDFRVVGDKWQIVHGWLRDRLED